MGCKNAKNQTIVPNKITKESSPQSVPLNNKFVIDQESLIKCSEGNIYDFYDFKNRLGEGGYGSVFLGNHNQTKMNRAIKILNKSKIKGQSVMNIFNEIEILKCLDHPNIMKLYEYYNNEDYLYVVGELIQGGELFDFICEKGNLSEKHSSEVMRQLFSAISYLHEKNIIHRDIKPENIIMTSKSHSNLNIKVIDFGISVIHNSEEHLTQKLGTPMYVAPEVLIGNYNEKCDEWSAGVIMYTLLTGYPPFQARSQIELLKIVKTGVYCKEINEYQILSVEAKDLIANLMTLDHKKRITAKDALKHRWFTKTQAKDNDSFNVGEKQNIVENLQKYRAERKIQLAIFYFFAHYLSLEAEKEKLMEVFRTMDKDANGTLSHEEILQYFKKKNTALEADKIACQIMEFGDINKNNKIDYSEFITATIQKEKLLSIEKIESVFKMFDKDSNENISLNEFKEIFSGSGKIEEKTWKNIFSEADENNDNNISKKEFKEMLLKLIKV